MMMIIIDVDDSDYYCNMVMNTVIVMGVMMITMMILCEQRERERFSAGEKTQLFSQT